MIKTKIVNVVATAALNQKVNLEEIRKFDEIFHDSDVYGGRVAYFKTKYMEGKVSIFPSGKMISIGTKSEEEASRELEAAKIFLIKKDLISEVSLEPRIRNIVVCADFEKEVNLEKLPLLEHVIYEPEQFPGAILRIIEPYKSSVLIFATGKTVITGLTATSQIEPIINRIKRVIKD